MASPFQSAIEAVLKPLEFAAREDFAQLSRVRNLEASVADAARRAGALAIPRDARDRLRRVQRAFEAPLDAKRIAREVERALQALRPLAEPSWSESALERSTAVLPGLGPKRAEALARRDLRTIADLLFHLPSRYDDRRSLVSVGDLEVGRRATFVARVLVCDFVAWRGRGGQRGRRVFEAVVGDDTGKVHLRWLHAGDAIAGVVRKDGLLLVTGDVRRYRFAKVIHHPEIERLSGGEGEPPVDREAIRSVVPDYPTTEGVHTRGLRRAVLAGVEQYADLLGSHLPAALVQERALPEPAEALRALHAPDVDVDLEALRAGSSAARARLVLEELYLLELGLVLQRAQRGREPGIPIAADGPRSRAAPTSLPFQLTGAQQRCRREILADLAQPHPMSRLLEGDVGSGKTVLAFLAAVAVAESGCHIS